MNKRCEACSYIGEEGLGTFLDAIYQKSGHPMFIRLCYSHSVELFKFGQSYFLSKYKSDKKQNTKSGNPLQNYFVFNPR